MSTEPSTEPFANPIIDEHDWRGAQIRAAAIARAYRLHAYKGGPWNGKIFERPRILGVGEHCQPQDGGPVSMWGAPDLWGPDEYRYRPVSAPDAEPVEMIWSLPTVQETRGRREFQISTGTFLAVDVDDTGQIVVEMHTGSQSTVLPVDRATGIEFGRALIDRAAHDYLASPVTDAATDVTGGGGQQRP